jgi:6-pyruvoyltetrahydropterin/6-carboxytetrahydropterin synthase
VSWTISKDFAFSAAHQLSGLPAEHQCAREHGHNYVVRVELAGRELDETGFILDYGRLARFGQWIDAHLDHRRLNDVPEIAHFNPTAENLAEFLHTLLPELVDVSNVDCWAVAVSETPKTWSTYRPVIHGEVELAATPLRPEDLHPAILGAVDRRLRQLGIEVP